MGKLLLYTYKQKYMYRTAKNTKKFSVSALSALKTTLQKTKSDRARRIGKFGEYAARTFLETRYFNILENNMRTQKGEVDVVCERQGVIHFVEVKSIEIDTTQNNYFFTPEVPNENPRVLLDAYDPIFRVSSSKVRKIKKAARYYIQKHSLHGKDIRFDVIIAYLFKNERKCTLKYYSNIFI